MLMFITALFFNIIRRLCFPSKVSIATITTLFNPEILGTGRSAVLFFQKMYLILA